MRKIASSVIFVLCYLSFLVNKCDARQMFMSMSLENFEWDDKEVITGGNFRVKGGIINIVRPTGGLIANITSNKSEETSNLVFLFIYRGPSSPTKSFQLGAYQDWIQIEIPPENCSSSECNVDITGEISLTKMLGSNESSRVAQISKRNFILREAIQW